jgi:hypothetical protein
MHEKRTAGHIFRRYTYMHPLHVDEKVANHHSLRTNVLNSSSTTMSSSTDTLIRKLYHFYRHTTDIDQKGLYFSPTCMQICRPIPTFAATTREQIVQYLKDAERGKIPVEDNPTERLNSSNNEGKDTTSTNHSSSEPKPPSLYTIRPLLLSSEFEFSTQEITSAINLSPYQLHQQAVAERWIGMRVDLWDENEANEGLLVKVQYWWREESVGDGEELEGDERGRGWRQCLHDIMYLGPRDGTEGVEGEVLE